MCRPGGVSFRLTRTVNLLSVIAPLVPPCSRPGHPSKPNLPPRAKLLVIRQVFRPEGLGRRALTLFGPTIAVARQAQVLFVVGPIAAMGWLGWQVAGRRGAILLGLGMATSAWM